MSKTKYISHRGNLYGSNSAVGGENSPTAICNAIAKGYDVEVDVRILRSLNAIYLGHDTPDYLVPSSFLTMIAPFTWFHAKTEYTLNVLLDLGFNTFYHDADNCVLTSKQFIWTYPGKALVSPERSVAVLPETVKGWDVSGAYAICSDIITS